MRNILTSSAGVGRAVGAGRLGGVNATDVLDFSADEVGALDRPVMLVGLEGWFDVASAATQAVNAFVSDAPSTSRAAQLRAVVSRTQAEPPSAIAKLF